MEPISLEDLALLEVLHRIDQCVMLTPGDSEIRIRLVESGLIVDDADGPTLTAAGVEMCKSLQHRVAADAQVAKVLQKREEASTPEGDDPDRPATAKS